jgi:hypothetical protein
VPQSYPVDLFSLTPVERIALAEALYDAAMREIEQMENRLSAAQLAEVDRMIALIEL